MTTKQIAKSVSLLLVVIIIGFTVAVGWSLNHLNQAFASVEFFGQQKDKIFTQVSQPILSYLLTGEATRLGEVGRAVKQIKTEVEGRANLSASLQAPFIGLLDQLQQSTLVKLTAAGKLADPQVLLINNEQQLSQRLQKLLSYVKEAKAAALPEKQLYLQLVGDSQVALINLARARQSFFSSRKQMSSENIDRPLQELIALAGELPKLPLLGVMKQKSAADDVLSFGEQDQANQPEDKAIEPIGEIPSLLQHYGKDMEVALKVAQAKVAGQEEVNQQISNLQQQLLKLEVELNRDYLHYEHVTLMLMGACALLIISAVLFCIFGGIRIFRRILGGEPEYAVKIANAIADYNLNVNIETLAGDESSLLASMKTMQASLALIIGNVNNSVHKLERSAVRLTHTTGLAGENSAHHESMSHTMAAAVEGMSSTVVEITATMEELSASSTQIADYSTAVVDIANHTLESSKKGSDSMQQLLTRMGDIRAGNEDSLKEIVELGARSKEISKVMEIINAIADQTKLIAFNAALEAAGAGDSGRRFGVVAAEIRRLADSVTDSTSEIDNKIQEIQSSISRLVITSEKGTNTIDAGMAASTEAARHLDDLVDAASQTSSAAQQISLSTQQQKTASSQVVSALREIVTASAHTAQSIRSITEIGNEMNEMSHELSGLVQQFKLADR
ncbi:MAG: methyl-accepting chemotaxis protein [Methylovulum sp.]|nr:methyl-accepting chemotaxis protein [Methylovulum sp.]